MPTPVTSTEVAEKLDIATLNGVWRNDGRSLQQKFSSIFGVRFVETNAVSQSSQLNVKELAYSPTLTFNGFVTEIGPRQNFDCVRFSLYPFSEDHLPDQCRVVITLGTRTATPVVDLIIPLPNVEVNQSLTIYAELGQLIANAGAQEVFLHVATNGRNGYGSANVFPTTTLHYIAQENWQSLLVADLTTQEAASVSPYAEIFAKTFICGSRNCWTNGFYNNISYASSNFSAWGNLLSEVPPGPFNFAQIWLNAFDAAVLPQQVRIEFRDGAYDGELYATAVSNVAFSNAETQLVNFFFEQDVDLSGYTNVWCGYATDGFVSLTGSHIPSPGDETYSAGPSGIDAAIGADVSSPTNIQPWLRTVLLDRNGKTEFDAGLLARLAKQSAKTGVTDGFAAQCNITLPASFYSVAGYESNIYFDGAINSWLRPEQFVISMGGSVGQPLRERWRKKSDVATTGNSTLTLNVNFNGSLVKSGSTSLKIKAASVGSGQTRKVLFIGDSITANGTITQTILDLVTANPSTYAVTLIGTEGGGANLHEGYSGWTYGHFATNVVPGSNRFWNGSAFDFDFYLIDNSFSMSSGDSVFLMLGTNDFYGWTTDAETDTHIATTNGYLATIINSIQDTVPGINIFIGMVPQLAYDADAFGRSSTPFYGYAERVKRNYGRWREFLIAQWGSSEADKIYLLAINCVLDTKTSFSVTTEAINSRNSATHDVITDPVHPSTIGSQQLADYCYAALLSLES